jgi:hypothetical protein
VGYSGILDVDDYDAGGSQLLKGIGVLGRGTCLHWRMDFMRYAGMDKAYAMYSILHRKSFQC